MKTDSLDPQSACGGKYSHLLRLIEKRLEGGSTVRSVAFSILTPAWNTKPEWFVDLSISILQQDFDDWEWCIVDDNSSETEFHSLVDALDRLPNVHFRRNSERAGISKSTNTALALAQGQFICCVDHDDTLDSSALKLCAEALAPDWDAVYTDSDKIDAVGRSYEPFHKPAWSPDYFLGVMYVGHLLCLKRSLALQCGGFDSQFDGVQDYEFLLRFSERSWKITHIPAVLYHWRAIPGSVAASHDAKGDIGRLQQKAVVQHLKRRNLPAEAIPGAFPHRISIVPLPRAKCPRVSIIIPTKDNPLLLGNCLRTLYRKTEYENFEVFCIDNESRDPDAIREIRESPAQHVLFPGRFNFSRANNLGVELSSGEYIVFMNNDVEVLEADWIQNMLYYAEQPDVGSVGARLLYPNGSVQHAGVVLGTRGTADHVLRFCPGDADGYAGSLSCAHECSVVTAACLMTSRVLYDQVGGFDEHYFTHYQDVDLCLKIRSLGKRIIYTPRARFLHHESISRGTYYDLVDRNLLLDRWQSVIDQGDPYFNPNFDRQACNYSVL